jgi:hypothetical protein
MPTMTDEHAAVQRGAADEAFSQALTLEQLDAYLAAKQDEETAGICRDPYHCAFGLYVSALGLPDAKVGSTYVSIGQTGLGGKLRRKLGRREREFVRRFDNLRALGGVRHVSVAETRALIAAVIAEFAATASASEDATAAQRGEGA